MTINEALLEAVKYSYQNVEEEVGGMILKHKDNDDYVWAPMHNDNSGAELARVLFTPSEHDYVEKVLGRHKEGYRMYASFHTHPTFPSYPSRTDLTQLFPNHNVNYIFSIINTEIAKYQWVSKEKLTREIVKPWQQKLESQEQVASVAA